MLKTKERKININLKKTLNNFPLRIAVTDYCNLRCFFCSNEGMDRSKKNKKHANINQLKSLIKILSKKGLKNISITGGDPTVYPYINELLTFLKQFDSINVFFHTNGINLNQKVIKLLSETCSKIAVSVNSVNIETWQKITGGSRDQFEKLISNLNLLSKLKKKALIELKFVPIKGYNFSAKEIKDFLDTCNNFKFKFKFLNFEPIFPQHIQLTIPIEKVTKKLINLGCKPVANDKDFRGQSSYLPIKKFNYKNTFGVVIEIGCGQSEVCNDCFQSNEIFITPEISIKPCHMDSFEIDLSKFIENKNIAKVYQSIIDSRIFLSKSPGAGLKIWQQNRSYDYGQ
jgi:GTP 3',8-cyclase